MKIKKNNTKTTWTNAAIVLSVLVLLGACLWWATGSQKQASFRFNWQEGTEYLYSLNYKSSSTVNLALDLNAPSESQQTFSGGMDIESKLSVKCYDKKGDEYLLGISLEDSDKLEFAAMGAPLYASTELAASVFEKQQGFVRISEDGTIRVMEFSPSTPEAVRTTLQTIMGDLQLIVEGEASTWTAVEDNIHGRASSEYSVQDGREFFELLKQRDSYISLNAVPSNTSESSADVDSTMTASLNRDGYVQKIAGKETIVAKNSHNVNMLNVDRSMSMELELIRDFQVTGLVDLLASLRPRKLGEIVVSDEAEKKALKQRTGGMTVERLVGDLLANPVTGEMPFHSRWVWRATGLLRLHPEAAWKLVDVFEDPRLSSRARTSILELLASTGGETAQEVIRELLESKQAAQSRRYGGMVARIAALETPALDTMNYVKEKVESTAGSDSELHHSTCQALGTLTNNLYKNGQEEEAKEYNKYLLTKLQGSDDLEDTRAYLRAVGKIKVPANVPYIAEFASNTHSRLRSAVAGALKNLQTPQSEQVMLDLAADPVAGVQKQAFNSMKTYDLTAEHIAQVEQLFDEKTIDEHSYGQLMTMLAGNYQHNQNSAAAAGEVLSKMVNEDVGAKMRYQIRTLLNTPGAHGATMN